MLDLFTASASVVSGGRVARIAHAKVKSRKTEAITKLYCRSSCAILLLAPLPLTTAGLAFLLLFAFRLLIANDVYRYIRCYYFNVPQ